jgi:hypothetical protein
MNKLILSLYGCSSSIAAIALATNTLGSTDAVPVTSIPYPEVMNLTRVPIFDANGMVAQSHIAISNSQRKSSQKQSIPRTNPAPITVDLVSKTVREPTINKYTSDCLGCRNLTPSMMVLGYSSDGSTSSDPRPIMY